MKKQLNTSIWFYVLVVLLLASSGAVRAQDKPSFTKCVASTQKPDFKTTIILCTTAIDETPTSAMPRFLRGRAYAELRSFDLARTDFDEALRLQPNWADALFLRGTILVAANSPQAALDDFNKVIGINPNHLGALVQRSRLNASMGKKDFAIVDLKKILVLKPNDAAILKEIAQIQLSQQPFNFKGRLLTSPEMYLQEVSVVDSDDAIKNAYVTLPSEKKRSPEIFELLTNCFSRFPEHLGCNKKLFTLYEDENLINRGFAETAMAKYIDGNMVRILNVLINADPKNPNYYGSRGRKFYYDSKNYAAAAADFTKAIDLSKKPPTFYYGSRAKAYEKNKEYELAAADYTRVIAALPKDDLAYFERAQVFVLQNNFDLAIADLTQIVSLNKNPLSAEAAYTERAKVYRSKGDVALAAVDEKRAQELKNMRLRVKSK